jgi:hypothetical protein
VAIDPKDMDRVKLIIRVALTVANLGNGKWWRIRNLPTVEEVMPVLEIILVEFAVNESPTSTVKP